MSGTERDVDDGGKWVIFWTFLAFLFVATVASGLYVIL